MTSNVSFLIQLIEFKTLGVRSGYLGVWKSSIHIFKISDIALFLREIACSYETINLTNMFEVRNTL